VEVEGLQNIVDLFGYFGESLDFSVED
jgi:hypothetical protein